MRKPIQAKYLAPLIHALLYLAMWGLYWAFAQPLAGGPAAPLFFLLFITDFPISFVAFGVLFTSVRFGILAAIFWGVLGTLWWYLIGRLADAGIRNFRKTDYRITNQRVPTDNSEDSSSAAPTGNAVLWNHRREWLIAGVLVVVLVLVSLAWAWNGPQGGFRSGRIALSTFAPDGHSVLLSRSQGSSSFLYKVALDTGQSARLATRLPQGIESSPAYSPDSRQVVFVYTNSQNDRPRIFIMDANSDIAHALFASQGDNDDFSPTFAPDGQKVYFARTKSSSGNSPAVMSASRRWDVYSVDLNGENLQALTDQNFQQFSTLSFSSDGKKLLFSTDSEHGSELHLYSLEAPSEPEKRLQPRVPHEPAFACVRRCQP